MVFLGIMLLTASLLLAGCGADKSQPTGSQESKPAVTETKPEAKTDHSTDDDLAKNGVAAFKKILQDNPKLVGFHDELSHWGLTFSTGDMFEWTKDTGINKADMALVLVADPLVKAGLDIKKLDDKWIYKPAEEMMGKKLPNRLIKPFNLDDQSAGPQDKDSAPAAFQRIADRFPANFGYHDELSHYGFKLGDGDKFEWTKDVHINDADVAFVLLADPLIQAGLDIKKLDQSWIFKPAAEDPMMGKTPNLLVKPIKLN